MNMLTRNNKPLFRQTLKHKKPKTLTPAKAKALRNLAIAFAIVLISGFMYLKYLQPHTLEAKQRVQLESTVHQLQTTKKELLKQESKSKADDDAKAKQIEELNKQIQEKDQQLQAKAASKAAYAAEAPAVARVYQLPEDEAKAYIYSHESGNNPGAINAGSGACGLGQALPCSKMPCSLSDYACQDAFFTQYAMQRYGSWNNARAFWVANHWW